MPKKTLALFTPEQVQRARQRLTNEEPARQAVQDILQMAQQWAQFGDEFLCETIPPPQVPRAFNISFSGCPVCGRETFKYGNYGFETPLEKPWKVICPNCKSEFPSNDFGAFLKGGMQDRSLLTGDYPDDGWGWKKPGEEKKYWFVAYYCHWHWLRHIIPAVHNLARAYLLTGDRRYAHKALVMLCRIADYYPDMDHNKQSRYATEFVPSYTGKIVNAIWETGVATNLAEAVDFVWDAVEEDKALQQSLGKDADAIKRHLYHNLLMEFVKGIKEYRISGNYGMHQKTLLTTAIVSQDPGLLKWSLDYLLNNTGDRYTHEGLNFALTNLFFREGMGHESAPGYHFIWNQEVARICDYLLKAGINLFGHPTVKRLFTYPFEMRMAGRFTPTIGDSGSVEDSRIDLPAWMAEIAYREYQDPLFYPLLPKPQGSAERAYTQFYDLFLPPLPLPPSAQADLSPYERSRNLGDYGLAILRSGKGEYQRALTLYYGWAGGGHGHYDRLNIELFGFGRKLLPDLGYPQFAADDPEPPGWTQHTVSHCTVMADAQRQYNFNRGKLHRFAHTSWVQFADASAESVYPDKADLYRRQTAMIDLPDGEAFYVVDVFHVQGGKQHDYSLHLPGADVVYRGIHFPEPRLGTLAGEDVPFGKMYDDPQRANASSGFYGYMGSGFAFLTEPQEASTARPWLASWRQDDIRLRIHWLPTREMRFIACNGYPKGNRANPPLKYLIARTVAEDNQPLRSTFVTVVEASRSAPPVRGVRLLSLSPADPDTVAVEVSHRDGHDVILLSLAPDKDVSLPGGIVCRAALAVMRFDGEGVLRRAFVSGGTASVNGLELQASDITGTVQEVVPEKHEVLVRLQGDVNEQALRHRSIRFHAGAHRADYEIFALRREGREWRLRLGDYEFLRGRALVSEVDETHRVVRTPTVLALEAVAPVEGMTVSNEARNAWWRLKSTRRGEMVLDGKSPLAPLKEDADGDGHPIALIWDFGMGDSVFIPGQAEYTR
ncbi:MAG: heparinase II/III domain-containing protein [Armatimonadota bacterium]